MLNNKGISRIEVIPIIYSAAGQELLLPPVFVEAQSFRFIDLQDWASIGGPGFESGNIKLFHLGKDLVLGAQIYLTDEAQSITFEEKLAEIGEFDSQRLETVWSMPSNNAQVRVTLTNTTDAPLDVTGILGKKPNQTSDPRIFSLAPHSTRAFDIRDEFPGSFSFLKSEVVALSLEHCGSANALVSQVYIYEKNKGYSNFAQFSNPADGKSSEYQGVGFQIEDIGNQKFNAGIVARNVGPDNSVVTINIPYTRTDGTRGNIALPTVHLSPGEMRSVNTNKIIQRVRSESIQIASIEATYTSAPGTVIIAAHSNSNDRNQVFRLPMTDSFAFPSSTGGYPWFIDNTSSTHIYIKNDTDLEEDYTVYISWENGGSFVVPRKSIAARETIRIDVKKLRDDQTQDVSGGTIPSWVSGGQLQWSLRRKDTLLDDDQSANLSLMGRSEQIDLTKQTVRSYVCANYCLDSAIAGRITYSEGPIEAGSPFQYHAFESTVNSFGAPTGERPAFGVNWTSSNPSVATIDYDGYVEGIGSGSTYINASWNGDTYEPFDSCINRPVEFNSDGKLNNCQASTVKQSKPVSPNDGGSGSCGSCRHGQTYIYDADTLNVTAAPCAYPVNFRQVGPAIDSNGVLTFYYTWDSSTGTSDTEVDKLFACELGERVDYSGSQNVYYPPLPFNQLAPHPNPTILSHSGANPRPQPDRHGNGGFMAPPFEASYTATQIYRWRCPCKDNNQWHISIGPHDITRSVIATGFDLYKYTITKLGYSATIEPIVFSQNRTLSSPQITQDTLRSTAP